MAKSKTAGSKAGNQYGTFKVRFCSQSQARFIERLLGERIHNLDIKNPNEVNVKHASRIIDELLKCPKKPEYVAPISDKQTSFLDLLFKSRQGADTITNSYLKSLNLDSIFALNKDQATNLISALNQQPKIVRTIVDVGAYKHDGVIYSVRKGRESGNTHAFSFNFQTKKWEFARGVIYELVDTERLSLVEAIQFGVLTGTCVHCGATLTQRKSVLQGIGPVCAKKYK